MEALRERKVGQVRFDGKKDYQEELSEKARNMRPVPWGESW